VLKTHVHEHKRHARLQSAEAKEYLYCCHLLLKHAPVHFQFGMHCGNSHAMKHRMHAAKTTANSEALIIKMDAVKGCSQEEHIEVLIHKEMLSKLPLLTALYESSEEDATAGYSDKATMGVKAALKIDDTFQTPLHHSEGAEGDPFCCAVSPRY
jgi:hypothetical protein